MKSNKPALMERASFKSIVSSLLAILMGLVVGFIIILIANPSDALQGLSILLRKPSCCHTAPRGS